jgi:hypothetical protein
MRKSVKLALAAATVVAGALAWGYWHAWTHAYLTLRVDDYGLRTDKLIYDSPHGVRLSYLDGAGQVLAAARSVEPAGYVLAIHPDPAIGDCSRYENSQQDYGRCYAQYARWAAQWAPGVRRADATIGACELRNLPVAVRDSNPEWFLWWVPLPHIGGVPHRYVELVVRVNTKTCAPAAP